MGRRLYGRQLEDYKRYLQEEEKTEATLEKYIRDVRAFLNYVEDTQITKEVTISYKKALIEKGYAVASVNSMLASLNSFLKFSGRESCCVKGLKVQKQIYCDHKKELTKDEYWRLLAAAKEKPRLYLAIQTICSTGIRVSELSYFTVESVKWGEINVACKNKNRRVLIPSMLRKLLLQYARDNQIMTGYIFCTRNGKPLNRSNIWAEMKTLCKRANVNPEKVYPHNLRKLFARTFYKEDKDIAKLADVLGHSSINTTRIYIISTGNEHQKRIEQLGLIWREKNEMQV